MFRKANLLLLTAALIFGQVGAGFFHNKHDAHEAVVDLDHTVLVEHGEHCKVCSVDWIHAFISPPINVDLPQLQENVYQSAVVKSQTAPLILFENGRAPPVRA